MPRRTEAMQYIVQFIATRENAEVFLKSIFALSAKWIDQPNLIEGTAFDELGPEKYFDIQFTIDPTTHYLSGWDLIKLCKSSRCHHKGTSQTLTSLAKSKS